MKAPLVIMGVSGVGKSTLGAEIACQLGRPFIDADHLHPMTNRRKMEAGRPLDDQDREPWLRIVSAALADGARSGAGIVVACSALKLHYREVLRDGCPEVAFVHLDGSPEVIIARMRDREHDYMPASLLPSQLETLEPPLDEERVIRLGIEEPVGRIAERAIEWLTGLEASQKEGNR